MEETVAYTITIFIPTLLWKAWKKSCVCLKQVPTLFMLLDLKLQAYAWPIMIYSKQDMSQLHDNSPKGTSLVCKILVGIYKTTLDIFFSCFGVSLGQNSGSKWQSSVCDTAQLQNVSHTKFEVSTSSNNLQICSELDLSRTEASEYVKVTRKQLVTHSV